MSHNIAHVEGFEESTKAIYRLLLLTDTPEGFLCLLPKFMRSLDKDKTCKKAYNIVKARLIREDEELQNHKQIVIDWMKSKLKQLRRLKCHKFSEVKKAIAFAELVVSGQAYEISSGGYLSVLTWYFEQACRMIAFYGYAPNRDKWLKITTRENLFIFPEAVLNNPIFEKIINPFTNEGEQISKRIGHGFLKAFVQPGGRFFDKDEPPRYIIEWGNVDSIVYPDSLQIWRRESQDLHHSKVQFDQKPEHNLRYLLHLCHFENLKPIPLRSLPESKSVLEAEALCNQQLLQYYLSGFKTDNWNKTPASREDIMSKLDRLLVFLQAEDNVEPVNIRGPRTAKDEARKFVQEILHKAWNALAKEKKKPLNYQELRIEVLKAQNTTSDDIRNAISNTLITQEISKFAKTQDWKPVRGKDKDRDKRHVN
jgi:hypothetical protein